MQGITWFQWFERGGGECREFHGLREEDGNATWFQLVRGG